MLDLEDDINAVDEILSVAWREAGNSTTELATTHQARKIRHAALSRHTQTMA